MTKGSIRLEVSSQVVIMLESTYFGIEFWAVDNVADALQLFEIPTTSLTPGRQWTGAYMEHMLTQLGSQFCV